MIFPAISLHQPWASASMTHLKGHETRSWPAPTRLIGQRIAIHAAKRPIPRDLDDRVAAKMEEVFGAEWRESLPRGAIVGTALLLRSTHMDETSPVDPNDLLFGDWAEGRWAWRLLAKKPLARPIPCIGRQGWFTVDIPAEQAS